jgi:hypothetical protein
MINLKRQNIAVLYNSLNITSINGAMAEAILTQCPFSPQPVQGDFDEAPTPKYNEMADSA